MAKYSLIGGRFVRKYTERDTSPVYAAEAQARKIVEKFCDVPWSASSISSARMAYHTEEPVDDKQTSGLDKNVEIRDAFDAAMFCAEHKGGQHRAFANAAVYRYTMPDDAVGKRVFDFAIKVTSDPYNSQGVRLHVWTSATGEIPSNCHILRGENSSGEIIEDGSTATGVVPREVRIKNGSEYWYPKTEIVNISPVGGIVLQKHLFIFVGLESYATVRGNWLEGSAFIENEVEITTETKIGSYVEGTRISCLGASLSNAYVQAKSYKKDDIVSMAHLGFPMGYYEAGTAFYGPWTNAGWKVASGRKGPGNGGKPKMIVMTGGTYFQGLWSSLDGGETFEKAVGSGVITESVPGYTFEVNVSINTIRFNKIYHGGGDTNDDGIFIALPYDSRQSLAGEIPWYSRDAVEWSPCVMRPANPDGSVKTQPMRAGCMGHYVNAEGNRFLRFIYSSTTQNFFSRDGVTMVGSDSPIRSAYTDSDGIEKHNYFAFKDIACDDYAGIFLATSDYEAISEEYPTTGLFKSTDGGETWGSVAGPWESDKPEYVFCKNRFFLINTHSGKCYYCYEWDGSDGVVWHEVETPKDILGNQVFSLEYAEGRMFMSTNKGMFYSMTGNNWTRSETGPAWSPKIFYRKGDYHYPSALFAAGNSSSATGLFRSDDLGDTWTKVVNTSTNDVCEIDYDAYPTRKIITTGIGGFWSSEMGYAFDRADVPATMPTGSPALECVSIAHNGRTFVAATHLTSASGIYRSEDGIKWRCNNTLAAEKIVTNGDIFLAVVRMSSAPQYSTDDGKSWKPCVGQDGQSVKNGYFLDLVYAGGIWVAIGQCAAWHSYDGVTWQRSLEANHLPGSGKVRKGAKVVHGNGVFVAVTIGGSDASGEALGEMYVSSDGIYFERIRNDVASFSTLLFNGNKFVAVINDELVQSPDGRVWSKVARKDDIEIAGEITTDGRVFVALLADGTGAAYSYDLSTWESAPITFVNADGAKAERILYAGGFWILFSSAAKNAAYSTDGSNWQVYLFASEDAKLVIPKCCCFDFSKRIVFGCDSSGYVFTYMDAPSSSVLEMKAVHDTEPEAFLMTDWKPIRRDSKS